MTIAATMKRVLVGGMFFLLVASPRIAFAAPTCSTFDGSNRPAANFAAFDKVIVRANGMQARAPALVTFSQGTRTVQMANVTTNDLGAFASDPNKTRLPASVEEGRAKIKVLQGSATASCEITMVAAAPAKKGGFSRTFYLTWGIVLALAAIALAIAQVRRWQAEKLEKEMDSIEWRHPKDEIVESIPQTDEGDDDEDDLEDAPLEIVELDPPDATQAIVLADDDEPDEEEPDEDELDEDEDEAADDRPFLEFEPPATPAPKPAPKRSSKPQPKRVPEPVKGEPSEAVTRLQEEVRSWRSR